MRTSGAAQHGDPHAVFSVSPFLYVFDKPKSTIFNVLFQVKSKFSGFRSLCTILSLCIYSIPAITCKKNLYASFSFNLFESTFESKYIYKCMYTII